MEDHHQTAARMEVEGNTAARMEQIIKIVAPMEVQDLSVALMEQIIKIVVIMEGEENSVVKMEQTINTVVQMEQTIQIALSQHSPHIDHQLRNHHTGKSLLPDYDWIKILQYIFINF